jgi:flavin reductase (DIM6/NTAB) family NADH-FMN oxidoreductase RutF
MSMKVGSCSVQTPRFDGRSFRNALGHFTTGIAIITAETPQGPIGATVSSFNSVSLDPPLVLFSLTRNSHGISHWRTTPQLGIVVLAETEAELSNRFARPSTNKWADLTIQRMSNGAPLVGNWLVHFECIPYAIYDGGDHDIFVCEVSRFEVSENPRRPLAFYAGQYATLAHTTDISTPPETYSLLQGW